MLIVLAVVAISLGGQASQGQTDDLIFIHHSCGENWLSDGLEEALLAKDYIDERNDITYGTDIAPDAGRPDSLADTPGDQTNMDHWVRWFNDYLGGIVAEGAADGVNRIVMFKSCYPISDVAADGTEPGDPFSSDQTLANYKAVYRHPDGPGSTYSNDDQTYRPLEDIFAEHPDMLFIVVTAPPRHYTAGSDADAHRARVFNDWLAGEWLADYNAANPGVNNVAVFNWFDVLANADDDPEHPNRLKAEYGGEDGDSHPNSTANEESVVLFATGEDNFLDAAWANFQGEVDDCDRE